jgi:hypothetical protein
MSAEPDQLTLLVCRHFQSEAEAAVAAEKFGDVLVRAYAPACTQPHLSESILEGLPQPAGNHRSDTILLGGCYLASREKQADLEGRCTIHHLDHCLYLFAGRELIDEMIDSGAYLFTPGWLAEWRGHLAEWGFDQPTARSYFGESVRRLVLLDTGSETGSAEALAAFAGYVNLPSETLRVGMDQFRSILSRIVLEWRLAGAQARARDAIERADRHAGDYAMAVDLLLGLTSIVVEEDAVRKVIDVFAMMFAPDRKSVV